MNAPLSFAQERLWFLQNLDPQDITYNLTAIRRLRGRLDTNALVAAFGDVAARHSSLRTRFPSRDGSPVAVVEPTGPVRVEQVDAESEQHAQQLVAERIRQPFDLAAAPPLRITLIRLAEDHHILSVVPHHIIADGWSLNILFDELAQYYRAQRDGVVADLPLPSIEYGEHAAAQRNASPDVDYWTQRLSGAASLDLPLDRARPARRGSTGGEIIFRIPPEVATGLGKLARQQRCTLFMVLLAAYQVLLTRHCDQDDIVVGSPTAGRDLPELEPVIGLFASTMVLRGDLSGNPTFAELISRTRQRVSEAMAHRDVPIERVLSALDIERDLSRNPLFQTLLTLHSAAVGYAESSQFADLTSEPYAHDCRRAMGDVTMDIWPKPDGLLGSLVYNMDLFNQSTIERMATRFQRLLAAVVDDPAIRVSDLPLLTAEELAQIAAWNETSCPVTADTVAELVVEQAARTPDAIAVSCAGTTLTYRSLVAQAAAVADRLRSEGVKSGDIVPIQLPRSAELVAELLGVMLADAAYLPIDPSYPESRIAYVLSDARSAPVAAGTAYLLYTSGSTGRPKGVVIPHSALTNFVTAMRNLISPQAGDAWLALTSLSFDISALELYLPLVSGGRVVMADEETSRDGAALARLIKDAEVTHVQATPSGWRMLLAGQAETGHVIALVGGEALPLKLARELRPRVRRLINMYGPTETTVWSTAWDVPLAPAEVSIGYPIANTTVHVLAGAGQAPIGVPGELAIGGAGLAHGYHGKPGLTAERFVATAHGRLYRTGDRVRRLADGRLEFLGRLDDQVKLRGFRVEPGEIEAVLESAVERAVVMVRNDTLIAYVAGETEGLREHAAKFLPDYMLPTLVRVDAFPLTVNGKVNRAALPDPARPAGRGGPPRTSAEKTVAAVFAEVLGRDHVGAEDDFFALGGHSLLATKVAARLGGIPLRAVFTHSTVAGLAASLPDQATVAAPRRRPPGTSPPLSPGQERLWFLQRLDPDDASYTMFIVRRVSGYLDVTAFRQACSQLVARHESLRTAFPEVDGRPVAVVHPPMPIDVEYIDVGSEAEARARAAQRTNAAFDLAAPPLRFTLMRLSATDHVLCVTMHHIIADGWSLNVFMDDLSTLYSGGELPELPLQQGDVAVWQRDKQSSLDYWIDQLADPPVLDLPRGTGGHGDFHAFRIPGDVASGLERAGQEHGATLFMVLLAAYQVLLARHTGQTDLMVGSPVAGRDLVELEPVVGYLSNTVVLRGDLSGNPAFTDLLERTRDTVLDAMANQDVPFESLLARLGIERDLSRTPLFQTMAVLHTQSLPRRSLGNLGMTMFDAGYRQAKFDLMLEAWRDPDSIYTVLGYDTAVFDSATVARLAERFTALLGAIAANPSLEISALPMLTEADNALLRTFSGQADGQALALVPELIDDAFELYADQIAVICGDESITYRELGERVASRVDAAPGSVIGIETRPCIDTIVALLATWRAGAAYLPLDPELPEERKKYMLADSSEAAHGLAYVLYTSGSTGKPKGVLVDHENLAARVHWMRAAYELGPDDRIVQLASLSFDTHAEEIYPALTTGATVVLVPDGPTALPALLAQQPGITVLDLSTAYFHRLVDMINDVPWPDSLRLVIVGGEPLHRSSLRRWRDQFGDRVRIVNTYGPTETTIVATAGDLHGDLHGDVHIGRPIPATKVRIEDEQGGLVPPGSPGELAIGGAGVARGYRNLPELTAQRFVHREDGRYYLTGDRVRWRPDGNLEFLGRLDDQIKIRGFRVEPGEIEGRLLRHPEVSEAKVIARDDTLIAYTVGRCEPGFLSETLPSYMIPAFWVQVDRLPLTKNGKIDTAALPDPEPVREIGFIAPRTEAEELVAFVWGEVLKIDSIGVVDDFFALGGHSLLAVQVAARLGAIIEVTVPIRMLFTLPTVEQLAAGLEQLLVGATS